MPEDPLQETAQQGPAHADRKRATSREDPRREDTAHRRGDRSGGRRRRQSETSVRGGVLGIAAVTLATIVITLAGALVAFVVSLVF